MARARNVVRLGIPALIVAGLALVALWRVAPPDSRPVATSGSRPVAAGGGASSTPAADGPLRRVADALVKSAVDREASIEDVEIRQVTSARTFWAGAVDERPLFVVLDPDVVRPAHLRLSPGRRVTLIGLVRPSPPAAAAQKDWGLDEATAKSVEEIAVYLHVTRIQVPGPESYIPRSPSRVPPAN